jgi:uncharacterized membrane protein
LNRIKNNKYLFISLVILFILNVVYRSIFINQYSLSFDEIVSIDSAKLDFGHIKHQSEWDNNPPFYYYLLSIWLKVFGINYFNARFLSILFISIGITFLFYFLRNRVDKISNLAIALILTFSPFLLFYSVTARSYSLVFLLAVCSSMLFFHFIENKFLIKHLIFLSLINFLIIYTHYIAGLILVAQFIFFLIYYKNIFLKTFLVQILIVGILIFLRFTKKQFLLILGFNSKNDFWLKPAKLSDFVIAINDMFNSFWIIAVFCIISIIFFIILFKKDDRCNPLRIYSLLIGITSILLLFIVGTFKSIFLSRYLIFTVPFVYLFIIMLFKNNKLMIILSVIIISYPMVLYPYNKSKKGVDFEIAAKIAHKINRFDYTTIINTADNTSLYFYFFDNDKYQKHIRVDSLLKKADIHGINDTSEINYLPMKKDLIYLIQSFNKKNSDNNDILRTFLNENYNKIYLKEYNNELDISIFKRKVVNKVDKRAFN